MAFLDFTEPLFDHWPTFLIATVVLLAVYFYCIVPYKSLKAVYHIGPTPLPLIGHLHDTIKHKGKIHLQIDEYYKKYGNVFAMLIFGFRPSLVVSDPEMIKDIFVKEFASFSDRPEFIKQMPEPICSMLTNAKQEKWKRIRSTLTPAFSGLKMKQMIPLINACCDNLIKKLGEVADKEESINIHKFQQCLSMDGIVSAGFGLQVDSQNNPNDPVLKAAERSMRQSAFQQIFITILTMLPFGLKIMERAPRLWMSNLMPIINIAEEIVRTKRENAESSAKKDLLDLMLAASDDPSVPESKKLTDSEVIAQSIVFLAAGFETTSTTLSFVCHHLATSPEIQDKVQQEIDEVWPDENQMPSYDMIQQLPYLDMVISEALRLYPPGFIMARACTQDCILKGIKIPEGLTVVVPAYSLHRDPAIYPDPDKFDPERFSPEAKQSRNPYAYVPFGHGPHNCIGMRFTQVEMRLALVRMLKKYRLEVAPDTKIPPEVIIKSTLTCGDINVRVVSRNK